MQHGTDAHSSARGVVQYLQRRANASHTLNRSQESIGVCLVGKLVSKMGAKEPGVKSCSPLRWMLERADEMFRMGFASTTESWDDIFADAPTTYAIIARRHLPDNLFHGAVGQ